MSFTGFSSDEEGSIVYDGEKFIVNVPVGHEQLEHFKPDGKIPVVYTHPSHTQNQQSSSDMPPSNNSNFNPLLNKETAIAHNERARREREAARNAQSQSEVQIIPVIPADLARDGEPEIVREIPAVREDWRDTRPLTHLQAEHVDHLLAVETDSLAREVLLGLKREGMPSEAYVRDFMIQFAEWGWDDLSSALAWQVLANVRNSHWDETFAYADEDHVEAVAQDRANDWIEGITIIHAVTGHILLDVTGVERADGSQYVGLQDYEVEALKGLPLIFVHNHTEEVGASDEDLESAFDAGAELLIVITPSGREQVFVRGRGRMVLVRDEQASYEVGPRNPEETEELLDRSEAQALKYLVDAPEYMFLQEEPGFIDRLVDVALERNLHSDPTTLTESELINLFRQSGPITIRETAARIYGRDQTIYNKRIHIDAVIFKKQLNAAYEYRETANQTGVDPALLAQLVLWETPHWLKFWENTYYGLAKFVRVRSFGDAQIQPGTAIDMLSWYGDKFADFAHVVSSMKDDDQIWNEDKVGRALFSNEEFSIRVAGVYLMHLGNRLESDMEAYHVQITDAHTEDLRSISRYELQMMTAIGYNQGEHQAIARLANRYRVGVESAIRDAISNGFVPDVFPPDDLQSELEARLSELGVKVTDVDTDKPRIRPFELELLTKVAYVRGLDQLLDDVERGGDTNVVDGIRDTLRDNDYDDNVLGKKEDAVDLYGLFYEGDRDES